MKASVRRLFLDKPIDRGGGEPVYMQLKNRLAGIARSGELVSGDKLPSIMEMSKMLSVSYLTVSKAVGELVRDGLLETKKGSGIYTSDARMAVKKPVAVFLGDYRQHMCAEFLQGISNVLGKHGMEIIPHSGLSSESALALLHDMLGKGRVSGAVGFSDNLICDDNPPDNIINQIPIVLLNNRRNLKVDALVYSDDSKGAGELADLIAEKTKGSVAYLSSGAASSVGEARKKAFEARAREKGLSVTVFENITGEDENSAQIIKTIILSGEFSVIACWTDGLAIMAAKTALSLGKRIPLDIAVTGFGHLDIGQSFHPSLTTVDQNFLEMGEKAASALLDAMQTRTFENPRRITTGTKLIRGESL
jgi:DNA-binding LacI/PurR family transcriptional regulator